MTSREVNTQERAGILEKTAAVIAAVIIVVCLGGSICMGLFGNGILGKEESSISKKELEEAHLTLNSDDISDEEKMEIAALDNDIIIMGKSLSGQQIAANSNSGNTSAPSASSSNGDYIFPNSSTEYLTDADVSGLSAQDLKIARNEIIARHGRIFDSPDLKAHFESKSWYHGTISPADFDANINSYLSKLEFDNIDMIKKYE